METIVAAIPQTGAIRLVIEASARQNFSARSAQKLVRRFIADEISYLLRVGEPVLVVGQQLYWRVPVQLAFPGRGAAGDVGAIDVNVETGQLLITPEIIAEITRQAKRLAA